VPPEAEAVDRQKYAQYAENGAVRLLVKAQSNTTVVVTNTVSFSRATNLP
jgi:hypothetical protein